MKGSTHLVLSLSLSLCATAVPSLAADSIKLADGVRVSGEATAYDGDTKILSFRTDDGRDLTFPLADLDGRSVYQVTRSKVPKDAAAGQLQLANYARDIHLYKHALRHYSYAKKADPSLQEEVDKEIATGRRQAAEWSMEQARAGISKGDLKEAEEWLTTMVNMLPNEDLTAQARTMLDDYYDRTHSVRDDQLEETGAELLKTDLKKGKQYYDRMIEKNEKGLMTDAGAKARREFEGAISEAERALRELDKFEKKNSDHAATIDGYRELIHDQIIEIRLNIASQYMVQSNYKKALSQVNQALVIDRENPRALAMRVRVENASSRGLDWF